MAGLKTQQQRRMEIQTLYNAEITNAKDISSRIGVPVRTVFRVNALIKKDKCLFHKKGAGPPTKIPPNDKRRISILLKSNGRMSVRQLTTRLQSNVGKSTVYRHLKRQNFVKSPVIRIPALPDLQVQKRVNWCKDMKRFDWSKTFFTDECSIWLDSGKVKVWTKKGQPVQLPSYRHPSKVHLWGGISLMGATPLCIFTENFNQLRYISTLNEYLIEQANALYGNVWILQEDNSPVHTGKVAKAWKSQFVPHRIDWLPNSPDLAPIENLWGVLKRRLMVRAPKTV